MTSAPSLNQMLLANWRQRDPDSRWGRPLLYGLLALGLGVLLWFAPDMRLRLMLGSLVGLATVLGLWVVVAASLLEQNHPHAARFVPGHLRGLREAALLAWLGFSGLAGLLLWQTTAGHLALPAALLICAALCVYIAWSQRNWALWLLLCFGPIVAAPLRLDMRWAPLWQALIELWRGQPWSVLALCLLALAPLLTGVFGHGDERHRAVYARRRRVRMAAREGMAGKQSGLAAFGRPGEWVDRPFNAVNSAWLAHVLARARREPASVMARAEIVLHGRQHWLHHLLGLGVALALVGLGFAIAFALAGPQVGMAWKSGGLGMGIGLASAGFNPIFALPHMLWHSRREQALLVLLPGMPRGAALNRAVAWLQLRHFLLAWGVASAGLLLLADRAGQPLLACQPMAALPLGIVSLLRASAGMAAPRSWTAAAPVLGLLLIGTALWTLHLWLGLPLWLLAAASAVVSAGLFAWRWRRIGAAPQALPAGRLA